MFHVSDHSKCCFVKFGARGLPGLPLNDFRDSCQSTPIFSGLGDTDFQAMAKINQDWKFGNENTEHLPDMQDMEALKITWLTRFSVDQTMPRQPCTSISSPKTGAFSVLANFFRATIWIGRIGVNCGTFRTNRSNSKSSGIHSHSPKEASSRSMCTLSQTSGRAAAALQSWKSC